MFQKNAKQVQRAERLKYFRTKYAENVRPPFAKQKGER